ncbi:CHASE2 domain-containing protein [Candidatus Parabeggiatoa sp. HSG14]|uniref:CHASE2 domain-containing protein n=1 Tax=Candidatus Parabeggiatoa sp. HSG14 TaxID=3055593 RepID=UPI0025A6D4FD|nr:CHASE2 domain-containing protein [Thiotrichales bacterium HSG14]
MSHFFKLTSLALIWRKLGQVWRWGQNRITSRQLQEKPIDVQSSFVWQHSPKELWLMIQPQQIQQDFRHRFMINMLIGLGIILLAFLFRDSPFMKGIENEGIDTLMQIRQKIIHANPDIPPFVWLDIDDNTHQAWNTPMFTPRNRLLNLINTAVNAGASLVIVDVDLSRKTPMDGLEKYTQGLAHHPYDKALSDFLGNYKTVCEHKPVCPVIILAQAFQSNSASPHNTRSSFLDEAVKKSAPYVQWASTLFFRDFYEHKVRHWWLWQSAYTDGQPKIIPSIQLLAAALIRNDMSQPARFENFFQHFHLQDSFGTPTTLKPPESIQIGKLTVSTGQHGVKQRVMFSMPWLVNNKAPRLPYYVNNQAALPVITILPAQPYAKISPTTSLESLKNSIVVIGGSYREGRDTHLTPLGEMPGALIIINAIHTLLEYEEIKPLSNWLKILIYLSLLVLMSFVLARFGYGLGSIILGVFVLVVLIPCSILLFNYGIWLDFMLPLAVVMQLLPL